MALGGGVKGLRIGVDHAYALEHIDAGQARAIEAALKVLERQGAVITPARMPDLADSAPSWMTREKAWISACTAKKDIISRRNHEEDRSDYPASQT